MNKQIFTLSFLLFFCIGLYAQPKVTGEPKELAKASVPLRKPVWSDDGQKLTFTSLKDEGLWEISVTGKNLRQVSAEAGIQRKAVSGNPLVQQMVDAPAKVAEQVKGLESLSGCILFNPVLSPKGDKIVFQAGNGKGLFVCNADGSGLRSIGNGQRPTWTVDGKYVVAMITKDDGYTVTQGELISINVATGAQNTLFSSKNFIALSPAISPDGTKLAFEEYASGVIYLINIQ